LGADRLELSDEPLQKEEGYPIKMSAAEAEV
jgi:hypothetical protein